MHSWEAIQRTLDYIEENICEEIQVEELAEIAALSLFYYQRLFTRLVKKPVREYIKLRRLAKSCCMLLSKDNRIIDVAAEYGFGSHEAYTRAFKSAYGITPLQYRDTGVGLSNFDKPDLLLNYVMVDEGVPLISDGIVLEMNIKQLEAPIDFLGVQEYMPFKKGKMLGERPGVAMPGEIWRKFFDLAKDAKYFSTGRRLGVCYHGDADDGYTTYFAGAEAQQGRTSPHFVSWRLPAREYAVCGFEAESNEQLIGSALGKAMRYTRYWLRNHGLTADGFFPEMYYQNEHDAAYMELWIPFKIRDTQN